MHEAPKLEVGRKPKNNSQSTPHESAQLHVTGEAQYTDDVPAPENTLHAYVGLSTITHALIENLNLDKVRSAPGVVCVVDANDIPGLSDIGPVYPGDPLIASEKVEFHGQILFAVAAVSNLAARRAARLAKIDYQRLPPTLNVEKGHANDSYVRPMHCQKRGDADAAINNAPMSLEGTFKSGGQEQMYIEGQASLAIPTEDGGMMVYTSSQHPSEGQKLIAEVLDIPLSRVTVQVRRMGGAFGGKETNANQWGCLAALLANKTQRPVRLRLSRAEDFQSTGKRHPFISHYKVGFDSDGLIHGLKVDLLGDCGISPDLSDAIVDRAMFHIDNCYYIPAITVRGYRVKTHKVSNTAFRGFGGPQGMLAIENIVEQIATATGIDPLTVRQKNFYSESSQRNTTHYGQRIEQHIIQPLVARLSKRSDYHARRNQIKEYNAKNNILKRGISLTPVKFGISFTVQYLNQAGALIHIYTDGSVQLNHGGTEMGQGLYTKVQQIVAKVLQIDMAQITCTATRTDKVPNTSPTAASSGSDLNGMAAMEAAQTLKDRLIAFAVTHYEVAADSIVFKNGTIYMPGQTVTFPELVRLAHRGRISLSATGYYRTPKIHYDRKSGTGRPFFYFAYGAAVTEVVIDTLTGEYQVLQVDICHDVGDSLNTALDIGQIEGGFIQGMGWLTTEELIWDDEGCLLTNGPATYKIPTSGDIPTELNVELFPNSPNTEATIFHSKAVGEPPLMLGISVWTALRDAISSVGAYHQSPSLFAPATPERVLEACDHLREKKI